MHAEHLQLLTLLTQLTHLALHCPTQQEGTQHNDQSMTEPVYQALGGMPKLISLQVDTGSPHMAMLKGLKILSLTRCERDWHFPRTFTSLTCLSELLIFLRAGTVGMTPSWRLPNPFYCQASGTCHVFKKSRSAVRLTLKCGTAWQI